MKSPFSFSIYLPDLLHCLDRGSLQFLFPSFEYLEFLISYSLGNLPWIQRAVKPAAARVHNLQKKRPPPPQRANTCNEGRFNSTWRNLSIHIYMLSAKKMWQLQLVTSLTASQKIMRCAQLTTPLASTGKTNTSFRFLSLVFLYREMCKPRINIGVRDSDWRLGERVKKKTKNRCKRCGVVASLDAIVTPPTLTLGLSLSSISLPAPLLCSLLLLWLLSTLGPVDRHQSPIGRRVDRFCPGIFLLFIVKCRVNSFDDDCCASAADGISRLFQSGVYWVSLYL